MRESVETMLTYGTMDNTLADIQKAMVYLRDGQELIACEDKHDICNDFDQIRDLVNRLRKRFKSGSIDIYNYLRTVEEYGQRAEYKGACMQYAGMFEEAENVWPEIQAIEDPFDNN
jgi:hypothetical protein